MIDTDWIGCSRCSRKIGVTSPACPHCGEPVALVRGVHYTRQVDAIERLKREGKHAEAAQLLLECIAATEAEARRRNWKPAPGYYRNLAIVYRKEHRYADEVALLERAQGILGGSFEAERLAKARQLAKQRSVNRA